MPAVPATRLVVAARAGLPDWADPFLAEAGEDFFASRAWFDLVLVHALPAETTPLLALCAPGDVALLMLRRDRGRLASLTTPYSLAWRPLFWAGSDDAARQMAGRSLARALRLGPPARLELLDPDEPGLAALRAGLAAGGIRSLAYDHVGNWHERLPADIDWSAYLAARPPALRTTVIRKLARARRDLRFELLDRPGPGLEGGVAAYEAVRAASWKPYEPFPAFDAALLGATAAAGVLRLGVLRQATDSQPVAAQYWIIDRGGQRATVLKLAHAEAARAASPGTVLTALMIRHLLENGVQELDFGRGDDDYKQLWVGTRRQRIGLVLADPLHPLGLAAIARQTAGRWRRAMFPLAPGQDRS
jgi:hypothetical protein